MRKNITPRRFLIPAFVLVICFSLVQIAKSAIVNHGKSKKAVMLKNDQFISKNGFKLKSSDKQAGIISYQKGNTTYILPIR